VAPNCPLDAAIALATRFRADLARLAIPVPGAARAITVTASVGIADIAGALQGSLEEFLREADEALYFAKRSGRDAIWVYDPSRRCPVAAVAFGAPAHEA
jgi:two-component system cell cycle response regulator